MKLLSILLAVSFLQSVYIKVLLQEIDNGSVIIEHPENLEIQRFGINRIVKLPKVEISIKKKQIYLNDKPYFHDEPLIISPVDYEKHLMLDGVAYSGYMRIIKSCDKLLVINHLDLEDYVSSVLKTEGWPGWAPKFYEIQAIISRTYALDKIYKNRRSPKDNCLYDICNTNLHQTYKGSHDIEYIKKAISSTNGLFFIAQR